VSHLLALVATTPLDDFLNRTDSAAQKAERVRDIGASLSTFGLLLALGVVVYLARVHRGSRDEIRSLLLVAGFGGVVLLTGAVAELAGIQSVFGTGWTDVLSIDASSSAMLRLLAGLLVLFGLADGGVGEDGRQHGEPPVRWIAGVDSSFGIVGLVIGVLSFSFDGHTVTKGPRGIHMIVDVVHVTAGGVWFGGIVALVVVAGLRHRTGVSIAELVVRFSSLATVALVAVALAGVVMAGLIVDDVGDLTSTVWGRRLVIKVVAVGVAAMIGGYHHFVIVRRLDRHDVPAEVELARARTTLVVEAIALVFVVIATGMLVNGSIS